MESAWLMGVISTRFGKLGGWTHLSLMTQQFRSWGVCLRATQTCVRSKKGTFPPRLERERVNVGSNLTQSCSGREATQMPGGRGISKPAEPSDAAPLSPRRGHGTSTRTRGDSRGRRVERHRSPKNARCAIVPIRHPQRRPKPHREQKAVAGV